GEAVGTVMVQWADASTWGPRPEDAGYIHGLCVRRCVAGHGWGRVLLAWAEHEIAQAGRPVARLECSAANASLCAYYERAGYTRLDDLIDGEYRAARFEKRVAGSALAAQQWRVETPHGEVILRQARREDVATLVTIEETAARWVRSLGIEPGT